MEPVTEDVQTPKFSFREDGDRPQIKKYDVNIKFRPNDQVYLLVSEEMTPEGPYTVSSVDMDKGGYTLCDADGKQIKDGSWFKEEELKFYDPFE